MSDLISRESLKAKLKDEFNFFAEISSLIANGVSLSRRIVEAEPNIDAKPVKHAEWGFEPCADGLVRCTNCFFIIDENNAKRYNYCPNCGATMDA